MSDLAVKGGKPVRERPFPACNTIGAEEKKAVNEVLDSGVLSKFLGTWSPDFYGGPCVQQFEREWAAYFGVKYAVSVNSATSGLYAAVGACDVGPGDEVIVSPYTMTASATGPLVYGATPVFADILPDTFCLDPESVRQLITPKTRAIIVVDLFGHPAEMDEIMAIAKAHRLTVIEDAAQAPGASYKGHPAGTLADMGVFSLNYHKTIHTGEGGMIVTNNADLAERLQLIRNHGEVVIKKKGVPHLSNLIGFNYRLPEIEAAIGNEQLKKLERLTAPRIELADYLTERLRSLPGIVPPAVRPYAKHVYYLYVLRYDAGTVGIPRATFAEALRAEGIPAMEGYVEPIYLQPIYQARQKSGTVSYAPGICPVTERMHYREVLYLPVCRIGVTRDDLADVVAAFQKVMGGAAELAA